VKRKLFYAIGLAASLVILQASDLNPLLFWEPYQVFLNKLIKEVPGLLMGVVFLSLLVISAINGHLDAETRVTK
jgi:hypothetical protein